MAIKSVKLKGFGGSGVTFNQDSGGVDENWTATFEICTDCFQEPRCTIQQAIEENLLPGIGAKYPPLIPSVLCQNTGISPTRVTNITPTNFQQKNCCCCFDAVLTYTIIPGTEDDQDPLDPFNYCPEIETYEVEETEVVESAVFEGYYEDDGSKQDCDTCTDPIAAQGNIENCVATRDAGTCGPIINTAGQLIEPLPTRNRRLKGYRISVAVPSYDADTYTCYEGTVNCEPYSVNITCCNFSKQFAAKTVMMVAVTGRPESIGLPSGQTLKFWRLTFDLLEDPRGWCQDYLNRGLQRAACSEDPDGHGGTLEAADSSSGSTGVSATVNPGQPGTANILDINGYQVTEPVNLDLDGQPLRGDSRYYLRYCHHNCKDHLDVLPMGDGGDDAFNGDDPTGDDPCPGQLKCLINGEIICVDDAAACTNDGGTIVP